MMTLVGAQKLDASMLKSQQNDAEITVGRLEQTSEMHSSYEFLLQLSMLYMEHVH
jgi:hypothetical protein